MERCVRPELLDELPPSDPRAIRSRDDLVRVNTGMGNCGIMVRALRAACNGPASRCIVDLGAGDGRFMLDVARQLHPDWPGTRAVLLDRRNAVRPETHKAFDALGWHAVSLEAEVLDWLARPRTASDSEADRETSRLAARSKTPRGWEEQNVQKPGGPLRAGTPRGPVSLSQPGTWPAAPTYDVLIANLFLHHFQEAQLVGLLRAAAGSTRVFIAVEPRRSLPSFFFCRLLWVIGCGPVTRHDARASVQAGFAGRELSRLWPADEDWTLREHSAGWFSHLFVAQRRE